MHADDLLGHPAQLGRGVQVDTLQGDTWKPNPKVLRRLCSCRLHVNLHVMTWYDLLFPTTRACHVTTLAGVSLPVRSGPDFPGE